MIKEEGRAEQSAGESDSLQAIQLNLLENAYDFTAEALRNLRRADDGEVHQLKFALIHVAQAVELLVKERLRQEHPILVFAQVDRASGRTVTVDTAVARLARAGVSLSRSDLSRIEAARRVRNELMHYEVSVTHEALYSAFVDLFEFAYVFGDQELGVQILDHLDQGLRERATSCIADFRREFVSYGGHRMVSAWPAEIVAAQYDEYYIINQTEHPRVPYGHPDDLLPYTPGFACHDCGVQFGQLHVSMCCGEACPVCKGQFHGEICPDRGDRMDWMSELAEPSLADVDDSG